MAYLLAKDTVNGAEGSIFVTRNGASVEVAGMRNIRAGATVQSNDMKVIGTRTIQSKNNGAKLTGKGNIYYGSNLFTDMILEYINTGVMPEFDSQITTRDPAPSIGNQVVAFYGCTLTGDIPIAILDNEETMLNYDFEFAYTRVARLETFKSPVALGN